ncbi:MAG: hypothetical protein L6R36_003128 [Xanthoria steineri]|nr:MAG: hypothetical protein L6R36_003128 [Xanthoria steineri]
MHDILIIGAGPAGLAVAARLREPTPSAVFTDAEHNRYQWIQKHSGRMNLRPRGHGAQRSKCSVVNNHKYGIGNKDTTSNLDIQVLDSSGPGWLHSWMANFAALGISHLRSPMFFHPCPRDRDGLLAFAQETGRCGECVEIANCVGKSMSKHRRKKKVAQGLEIGTTVRRRDKGAVALEIDERDRKDYFTPSAGVFGDYCADVVGRYGLEDLVEEAQVASIDSGSDFDEVDLHHKDETTKKIFKVTTTDGIIRFAKVVVLAIGAGGKPNMPRELTAAEKEGACHSTQLPKQVFLAPRMMQKILKRAPTAVMVVGGGLTAAQTANQCIENGVGHVFMVMRSALKLKPFDIDLDWMGKFQNVQKATFWSADSDEERLEMLLTARNGGSIPPRYFKKLQAHVANRSLSIHIHTTVVNQTWDEQRRSWYVETDPPIVDLPPEIDYIYYATGVRPDADGLPFLSPLREKFPIEVKGGLPCLTQDLAWAKDVPLFVAGRLAGLRIGPDCGNLEGARAGAERISWAVEDVLEGWRPDGGEDADDEYHRLCHRVGSVNMYESLDGFE